VDLVRGRWSTNDPEVAAFADLFARHSAAVYNHCFRRTGSWSTAEELMAITFLELWRCRRSMPAGANMRLPWILAVANNVMRNRQRSHRRYAAALARLPKPETTPDPADDAAARVDAERRMSRLLPVLRSLPERELRVIELCVGAGLTHQEAAEALAIPLGTVKSRLARGMDRLRTAEIGARVTASDANEVSKS
jgi:RNA polymerase sigma-70 factor, ECF subfamily